MTLSELKALYDVPLALSDAIEIIESHPDRDEFAGSLIEALTAIKEFFS